MDSKLEQFMTVIKAKNPAQPEFYQAVHEVAESLIPFIEENPKYKHAKILERIAEPERIVIFRVPWINDKGGVEINRGFPCRDEFCHRSLQRRTPFSPYRKSQHP